MYFLFICVIIYKWLPQTNKVILIKKIYAAYNLNHADIY